MGILTNSKLVMTWRAVSDLAQAEAQVARTAKWPKIGSNSYAAIFDGGNILVGFWVQKELFANLTATPPETRSLVATALAGNKCCGQISLSAMTLVSNPASAFVMGTHDIGGFVASAPAAPGSPPAELPTSVSLVDDDGNFLTVQHTASPAVPDALPGAAPSSADPGAAPSSADPGIAPPATGITAPGVANPFTGFNFMVSNLAAAKKFYSTVLGLQAAPSSQNTAVFRSGRVTINLAQETAVGLVHSLNAAGRLNADWLMFAVANIEGTATQLERAGVKFPTGIEDSPHGRGAYFNDPDGHPLNLWQPPARSDDIDYFPVLNRLLS
jgi:predicted enzyme related to lactoylglutathione lyase